jgi:hypothetical protein
MLTEERLKQELVEDSNTVRVKAERLARLIEHSKHFVCFTGAGISTAVGIPDYRSAEGTVIQTGPGAYERPKEEVKRDLHSVRKKVQSVGIEELNRLSGPAELHAHGSDGYVSERPTEAPGELEHRWSAPQIGHPIRFPDGAAWEHEP